MHLNKRILHLFVLSVISISNLSAQRLWTLSSCIDTALENNIQIKQSEIQAKIADNSIDARWGSLFPTVNASAGYNWNFGLNIDPVTNLASRDSRQTNSLSLNAQWTLFNGLQNFNNLSQARMDHMSRVYQLEDMKNNTSLTVASQYVQILLNKEILKIAEEQIRVTNLQVTRMKQLVDAGAQPQGSLFDIQAQQARDNQTLIASQNNLAISKLQLAQTLQLQNTFNFDIFPYEMADPDGSLLSMTPEAIYEAALDNQPIVKASEVSYKSAVQGVKIAKGAVWPSLSLFASLATNYSNQVRNFDVEQRGPNPIGTTASGELVNDFGGLNISQGDIKDFGSQYNDNLNEFVGFNLSVPIWTGFQLRNGIRNAQLNEVQSKLQLQDTKNQLRQTIERAYTDAKAALETFASAQSSVRANEEAFKYAQVRFDNGAINQFDYENARNGLTQAKAQLAQARFDYVFRIKTLEFYLTGSIQP
jgi:outer membrane protein